MSDFSRAQSSVPVAIGSLEVRLYRADPDKPGDTNKAHFNLSVKYSPGGAQERAGNLAPHLTAQEISQLQSFMDTLYARAVAAILPEGTP